MDIFVGNLPKDTSVLQLRKLIGKVGNARFRIVRSNRNGKKCCYGHAVINSAETGRDIIDRLNGAEFNQCQLEVRRFIHRSDNHDRRCRKTYPVGWNGVNRRRGERRGS